MDGYKSKIECLENEATTNDSLNIIKSSYSEWKNVSFYNKTNEEEFPYLTKKYSKITPDIALFTSYKIGSGAFGKVYYGIDISNKKEYAIKIQSTKTTTDLLAKEYTFLKVLKGSIGFPEIHYCGEWKEHKVMAQDLLGPSLDKVFIYCNKLFKMETVAMIGIEMIDRLENLHRHSILHRDIKPNNFIYGRFNSKDNDYNSHIYLIDFGLSCHFFDSMGKHYEWNDKSSFVGTPRYASINTHNDIRQSRRDDLESMAYVLIYFAKGKLPWQGMKAKTKEERKELIKRKKKEITVQELCEDLSEEFSTLLYEIRQLSFQDKPNYNSLRSHLNHIITNQQKSTVWQWESRMINDYNESNKESVAMTELFEGYPMNFKRYIAYLKSKSNQQTIDSAHNA